jgi:carboxyl-terminal processing protease
VYPSRPYDASKDPNHVMLPDDPQQPAGPTPPAEPEPAWRLDPAPVNTNAPLTQPPPRKRRLPVLPLAIVLVAILAGGALFMSGYTMGRQLALEPGTPPAATDQFEPFWDTYRTITQRYAGGDVDEEALIQGAIRGMIEALGDPYSSYLTSEEYRQSLQGISGQFEGIGAEMATEAPDGTQGCATLGPQCSLVVVAPLEGSPAEQAGLEPGDFVIAADGAGFDGLTVDDALDRVRGPKGTTVALTIRRGTDDPFVLEITRDVIQAREVRSELLEGNIGYVRLAGFSDASANQLEDEIQKHLDAGSKKLILDLRGNPGGYVTAARDIASEFVSEGALFYEEDAQGRQVETDAVPGGIATDPSIEVIVLIDEGSASASEIVAGALKDHERATLVGHTTFGKGTVQQWQELPGEGGAFRLTIARWLTPNKSWIHDKGIAPDVAVTVPENVPADSDPILDRAVELLGGTSARDVLRTAA